MTKRIVLLFALLFIVEYTYAQTAKSNNIRLHVLRLNKIGKTYTLNTEDSTVTELRYLGKISTSKGKTYKILTSVWIWGISHRATNRILVYTANNRYVGNYYLTLSTDLPDCIMDNKLVFRNKEPDCDSRLTTYLDFNNDIPKKFFRKCRGERGDIYTFSKD
ncbi:hypothetical protein IM792_02060 [Mucilaginibacter sp. JRF]|uniref:hypothetical protein n=1 Tax=Mucilaginibacter sp. JRF TaxID=2780088 RepID=UPI00188235C2|nr:hypothetical protein [Mucilaginibacter sp. JRF]MBE9583223.1 hypothetical protein [Mucilaginibacter sp. JRF]